MTERLTNSEIKVSDIFSTITKYRGKAEVIFGDVNGRYESQNCTDAQVCEFVQKMWRGRRSADLVVGTCEQLEESEYKEIDDTVKPVTAFARRLRDVAGKKRYYIVIIGPAIDDEYIYEIGGQDDNK